MEDMRMENRRTENGGWRIVGWRIFIIIIKFEKHLSTAQLCKKNVSNPFWTILFLLLFCILRNIN